MQSPNHYPQNPTNRHSITHSTSRTPNQTIRNLTAPNQHQDHKTTQQTNHAPLPTVTQQPRHHIRPTRKRKQPPNPFQRPTGQSLNPKIQLPTKPKGSLHQAKSRTFPSKQTSSITHQRPSTRHLSHKKRQHSNIQT